jgi:transposase InsO family protein
MSVGHNLSALPIRLYPYPVIGVWRRKVAALDIADRENLDLAVNLLSRACWRVRIIKSPVQPQITHADADNDMDTLGSKDCLNEKYKNSSTGHG